MMKNNLRNSLIVLLAALFLTACHSGQKTPADMFKGQTAEEIFNGGEKDLAKHRYDDAIKHFEGLDALYPFSKYEQQAQLDIIYAYYKATDYASASAAAMRYIHLYPRSENVDYAYYMKGLANFNQDRGIVQRYVDVDLSQRDLSSARQSYVDFGELIRRFPDSPYAPDARERMVTLRNLLADQELTIAKYYYAREAYVASANRANFIVDHYQHAPAVIPALGVLVASYKQLNLTDLQNKTMQVLALNYPNSDVYKELSSDKPVKKSKSFLTVT